jgi:hypothetical protein
MTGSRPAGRPWTLAEEAKLRVLIALRDLACGTQTRSLPSERLAYAHAAAQLEALLQQDSLGRP